MFEARRWGFVRVRWKLRRGWECAPRRELRLLTLPAPRIPAYGHGMAPDSTVECRWDPRWRGGALDPACARAPANQHTPIELVQASQARKLHPAISDPTLSPAWAAPVTVPWRARATL